jgi:hypothetical protein
VIKRGVVALRGSTSLLLDLELLMNRRDFELVFWHIVIVGATFYISDDFLGGGFAIE